MAKCRLGCGDLCRVICIDEKWRFSLFGGYDYCLHPTLYNRAFRGDFWDDEGFANRCYKKQAQNLNNISLDEFSKTWQERLCAIIMPPSKKDALKFIGETACDAFEKLRLEFEKTGWRLKF